MSRQLLKLAGGLAGVLIMMMALSSASWAQSDGATEVPADEQTVDLESIRIAMELADRATRGEAAEYVGASGRTIGVVMPAFDNDGWVAIYIGVLAKAIETETSITTLNAQNTVDRQVAMIEDLITRQVDAIIFVPTDSAALSIAVQRANEASIPIIAMDRSTEAGSEDALVESDNRAHGAEAAQLLFDIVTESGMVMEDLKLLELLGDQATSAGVERHDGFSARAEELGIPILTALPTNWDAARANAAVLDAFQSHPDINAIFMASGCALYPGVESALRSLNKLIPRGEPGHIILVSIDGCPGPLDAVRNGYVDADAAQQLVVMGQEAVGIAVNILDGNAPQEDERILRLLPDAITPDNVDSLTHWANVLAAARTP